MDRLWSNVLVVIATAVLLSVAFTGTEPSRGHRTANLELGISAARASVATGPRSCASYGLHRAIGAASAGMMPPLKNQFQRARLGDRLDHLRANAARRGGGFRRGGRDFRQVVKKDDFICNERISSPEVRVLDDMKQMIGVMSTSAALQQARGKSMDLILINPTAEPPLARIMKIDKYRYELKRAEKEKSKQQRASRVDVKELKVRPNTDVHDYQVRLRKAIQFLEDGDRVKVSCQFKGREMAFQDQGRAMMKKFMEDLDGYGTGSQPRMNGRTMVMMVTPMKGKKTSQKKKNAEENTEDRKVSDVTGEVGLVSALEEEAAADSPSPVSDINLQDASSSETVVGSNEAGSSLTSLDDEDESSSTTSASISTPEMSATAASTGTLLSKPQLRAGPQRPNIANS